VPESTQERLIQAPAGSQTRVPTTSTFAILFLEPALSVGSEVTCTISSARNGGDQCSDGLDRGICRATRRPIRTIASSLVEPQTRYVMLVKVAGQDTEAVVNALIKNARKLPQEL
jgi:hypothetical protein